MRGQKGAALLRHRSGQTGAGGIGAIHLVLTPTFSRRMGNCKSVCRVDGSDSRGHSPRIWSSISID